MGYLGAAVATAVSSWLGFFNLLVYVTFFKVLGSCGDCAHDLKVPSCRAVCAYLHSSMHSKRKTYDQLRYEMTLCSKQLVSTL